MDDYEAIYNKKVALEALGVCAKIIPIKESTNPDSAEKPVELIFENAADSASFDGDLNLELVKIDDHT